MATLERAIQIAVQAHTGQKDKRGAPYILHPLHLMSKMYTDPERIIAVLHDVVEDSDWTLEQLRNEGFSDEVLAAVDCMTHRADESYQDFIDRANLNTLARTVKIADLLHNLDASRILELTDKDVARIRKYQKALAVLVNS